MKIAVDLTLEEIRGLRMALRWGVPDPEPAEIASARQALETAETNMVEVLGDAS